MNLSTSRSPQWQMLLDVAKRSHDVCAQRRAALVTARAQSSAQLRTLIEYRSSYQELRAAAEAIGVAPDELRNHQSFGRTLERATEEQADRLASVANQLADCEAELRQLQQKIHAFQVVIERVQRAARLRERRQEQGADDEMASLMRAMA
jgi:flagellar export protein FliJ